MTVVDQTKKVAGTAGDSSNTTFSFSPMVIFAASELEVVTTVVATGVETVRSQGTGGSAWSIDITSFPATGSITYPEDEVTPLASTHTLTIRRKLTLEQQTDLENRGSYDAEVQETALDKLVMLLLQQQEELDRSLHFPVSYVNSSLDNEIDTPLGSDVRYLAISADRDALVFTAIAVTDASAGSATPLEDALTAAVGTGSDFSREDHVHPLRLDQSIVGGDIASASPLVIDTDGNYFDITGTTGFAAMTVAADRFFILQFDGILTMTHHATNLNLPGGVDITTSAGGRAICQSTSANLVHVIDYIAPHGQWVKGGDIVSASPLVIDTDGDYFDITGTTGFAAMTVKANRFFILQFDAVLTMTHHATNLDLPGEADITTVAGDIGIFFSTGQAGYAARR